MKITIEATTADGTSTVTTDLFTIVQWERKFKRKMGDGGDIGVEDLAFLFHEQAKRTDIQYVVAGAGSKDMVKRVMDGDAMIPVDVLYPPAMVGTALELTASAIFNQVPVHGTYTLDATLITKDNAANFYFPDSPF